MRSQRRPRSELVSHERRRARIALSCGAALALTGLLFGVRSLEVPGAALIALAALAGVWVRLGTARVTVERTLVEQRAVEGDPFEATLNVRGGRFAVGSATVLDDLSGREIPVHGGAAGRSATREHRRGRQVTLTVVAAAGRRGRHLLAAPALRFEDPFGLVRITRRQPGGEQQVIVLPRVEPVHFTVAAGRRLGGEVAAGRSPTGAGELDGLREYRPGTPAARIHWPALARGAGLLERRLVAAIEGRPLIVVDPRCGPPPDGHAQLDEAIRAAASLARELARRGGCDLLLPGLRLPVTLAADLRAWPSLHTALALVEPQRNWRRTPALRAEILRGPLLYVGAAELDLPAAVRSSPYPVIRVLPASVGSPAGGLLLEVAGCAGWEVGRRSPVRGTRTATVRAGVSG